MSKPSTWDTDDTAEERAGVNAEDEGLEDDTPPSSPVSAGADTPARDGYSYDEACADVDRLTERSAGAMAIAEGDEGWEQIPLDCPMLVAVSRLRSQVERMREDVLTPEEARIVCQYLDGKQERSEANYATARIANVKLRRRLSSGDSDTGDTKP